MTCLGAQLTHQYFTLVIFTAEDNKKKVHDVPKKSQVFLKFNIA